MGGAPGHIGSRVVAARERRGISREALAVRSGLSWSAIAQIESGRRPNPRAETLAALAQALGVTVDHLLGVEARSLLHHEALIYDGRAGFVENAAPFVAAGLAAGEPTLVVSSAANRADLRDELGDRADSARFADSRSWYRSPLAAFRAYRDFIAEQLREGAPWVRILGEPSWNGNSADLATWTRYEALIDLAFAPLPVILACPYDGGSLAPEIIEHAAASHDGDPAETCLR